MSPEIEEKDLQELLKKKKISRRKALSTAGKVAISAIVAGVIAGAGGYFAGSAAAPTKVKTVTFTQPPKTVTKTVTMTATPTATTTSVVPTPKKAYSMYYSPPNLMEDWHIACWQGGLQWAKQVGLDFTTLDPNNDPARQIDYCKTVAELKPDGFVMIPVDPTASAGADLVVEAGVPMIVVDRDVTTPKVKLFIAFDSYKAGQESAKLLVKKLEEKYGTPKGKVILSHGDLSSVPGRDRGNGAKDVLKEYPDIEIVNEHESPHFMVETSLERLRAALESVGKPDAIWVGYTGAGIAAMKNLEAMGWLKPAGDPEHVIVAGIDCSPAIKDNVKQGYIDGLIDQPNLFYVPLALYFLIKWNEEGEKAIPKPGDVVKAEDVPLYEMAPKPIKGINPWKHPIWAPAEVVMAKTGHPQMKCKGFLVTKETADHPSIFANVLPKWFPLIK
ncbi:MAG TPA: sugar ABC transporter substrate-binding protein [Nitrososphaeria archaeon]|nr:sugar ABC transporter substrate-binding protein [Nitrososphaeria archaeon]